MKRNVCNWDAQPLGQIGDAHLAAQLGCTTSAVTAQRHKRGIPAFAGPNLRGKCRGTPIGKPRVKPPTPTESKPRAEPAPVRVSAPNLPCPRPQWPTQPAPRRSVAPVPSTTPAPVRPKVTATDPAVLAFVEAGRVHRVTPEEQRAVLDARWAQIAGRGVGGSNETPPARLDVLRSPAAARRLGRSEPWLYRLVKDGRGPPRERIGRTYGYEIAALDAWALAQGIAPEGSL